MTTTKLQETATGSANVIRRLNKVLWDEISKNTVEVPRPANRFLGWERFKRPETVTYQTQDIMDLASHLEEMARRLDWYSRPTEMRAKLDPPRQV